MSSVTYSPGRLTLALTRGDTQWLSPSGGSCLKGGRGRTSHRPSCAPPRGLIARVGRGGPRPRGRQSHSGETRRITKEPSFMFANVVVDLEGRGLPGPLTYAIPEAMRPLVRIGTDVQVPLGTRQARSATLLELQGEFEGLRSPPRRGALFGAAF